MEVIQKTTSMKRQASETYNVTNEDETITETDSDNGDLKPLVGLKEEAAAENDGRPKNSFFFDKNEGDEFGQATRQKYIKAENLSPMLKNMDVQNAIRAALNVQDGQKFIPGDSILQSRNSEEEEVSNSIPRDVKNGEIDYIKVDVGEETEDEEEIIELEFLEREVHKVHTHNTYCPNCRSKMTKVVLRRRRVKEPPRRGEDSPHHTLPGEQPDRDLFGCLKCFSFFTRGFNCFGLGGESPRPLPFQPQGVPDATQPGYRPPVLTGHRGSVAAQPSQLRPDDSNVRKSEIIKSIVYGGLAESITSLSVISSAAASDASTLGVVTLGFANLIGGLFVIGQNLLDLKNDNQQVDRYKELLGQKQHFFMHATLAILSYLVFGLVPPVVYGFTFRETDNRDFKLLAVAAASLTCVVVLAIGKAYTTQRGQHKFTTYLKTILYYLATAIMASGVGFAVGELVKKLMEELGWFEPNQAATLLFPGKQQSLLPSFVSY